MLRPPRRPRDSGDISNGSDDGDSGYLDAVALWPTAREDGDRRRRPLEALPQRGRHGQEEARRRRERGRRHGRAGQAQGRPRGRCRRRYDRDDRDDSRHDNPVRSDAHRRRRIPRQVDDAPGRVTRRLRLDPGRRAGARGNPRRRRVGPRRGRPVREQRQRLGVPVRPSVGPERQRRERRRPEAGHDEVLHGRREREHEPGRRDGRGGRVRRVGASGRRGRQRGELHGEGREDEGHDHGRADHAVPVQGQRPLPLQAARDLDRGGRGRGRRVARRGRRRGPHEGLQGGGRPGQGEERELPVLVRARPVRGEGVVHRLPWEAREGRAGPDGDGGADSATEGADGEEDVRREATLSPLRRRPDPACVRGKFANAVIRLAEGSSDRLWLRPDDDDDDDYGEGGGRPATRPRTIWTRTTAWWTWASAARSWAAAPSSSARPAGRGAGRGGGTAGDAAAGRRDGASVPRGAAGRVPRPGGGAACRPPRFGGEGVPPPEARGGHGPDEDEGDGVRHPAAEDDGRGRRGGGKAEGGGGEEEGARRSLGQPAEEVIQVASSGKDLSEECREWAERGDCGPNGRPYFMQKNCPESCNNHKKETKHVDDDDETFHDLSARYASGKRFEFDNLEGYVTVIVNTARMCD
ncbi:hypothetical protein THAOC_19249, partial [Thalassiosira oceanica]